MDFRFELGVIFLLVTEILFPLENGTWVNLVSNNQMCINSMMPPDQTRNIIRLRKSEFFYV